MKKKIIIFLFSIYTSFTYSQIDPTLSVGLETLTMNKGTIDVQVLTEIISDKQRELKDEVLKRFLLKLFPDANYTTKFYIQNCLNILLNEKNPKVIEKEILELTTNYSLALGVTYALIKIDSSSFFKNINYNEFDSVDNLKDKIYEYNKFAKKIRGTRNIWGLPSKKNLLKLEIKKVKKEIELNEDDDSILYFSDGKLVLKKRKKLEALKNKISKIKQQRGIHNDDSIYNIIKNASITINTILGKNEKNSEVNNAKRKLRKFKIKKLDTIISKFTKEQKELLSKEIEKFSITELAIKKTEKINSNASIPFNLALDVVSYALSDIEELNKKGFFKNKIDYTKGDFYLNLNETQEGINLRDSLIVIKEKVIKKIKPYIEHYDVIKDLIKNSKEQDKKEIVKVLINRAVSLITDESSNSELIVASEIEEIATRNDYLKYLNEINEDKNNIRDIPQNITIQNIKDVKKNVEILSSLKNSFKNLSKNKYYISREGTYHWNYSSLTPTKTINFEDLFELISITDTTEITNSDFKKINDLINEGFTNNYEEILEVYQSISDENSLSNPIKYDNTHLTKFETTLNDIKNNIKIDLKSEEKKIKSQIKDIYKYLVNDKDFYKKPLKKIIEKIEKTTLINTPEIPKIIDTLNASKYAKLITELYSKLKKIDRTDNISLGDINFIENEVSNILIELSYSNLIPNNNIIYENLLNDTKIITPLLKIKKLEKVDLGIYNEGLHTLFEFISNLNNLDKAETFESIIDMLRKGSGIVESNLTNLQFKESYLLFINAMKKYTIVNVQENYLEVDVASFLNDLQSYYNRNDNSVFSLYLSLGLNENFFLGKDFKFPQSEEQINNIGFASEKLGLRFRLHNFKRFSGYQNVIKDDIYLNKKAPFINDWYGLIYGSGLLYSLANTSTNENFDFTHIGIGTGLRFYNSLDVNLTIGFPFVKDRNFGNNVFIGLGFDIPLGEYLEKIGNKK